MSYHYRNVVLVVAFNYSNCVCNKDFIKQLYEKHFKQIIFYSDLPTDNEVYEDVNYIYIEKGYFVHNIFKHLYANYQSLLSESDGLFYTMDDNIINTSILNLYSNDKIIYYFNENGHTNRWFDCVLEPFDNCKGGWFDGWYDGKKNVRNLLTDPNFQTHNINTFTGKFSDFFYLPKRFLTNPLFELFELFVNYRVFLEIAIPSIIHNLIPDKSQYHSFTDDILWEDREKVLQKEYIYHSFHTKHNLFLHPIKFNLNPSSKDWLIDILCKEKCVIITTIHSPTEAILKHIDNPEYDVIIVGDHKTPDDYKDLNCIYLDVNIQHKLFPELSHLIPYNHYCRKNLGYLYAIQKGYTLIYETDDDNIPYEHFDNILNFNKLQIVTEQTSTWINIFKYFTNNAHIWPRGYPLSLIKTKHNYRIENTYKIPSIVCGLVENDPDVDALFRLVCNHQENIKWDTNKTILVSNRNMCVFNTQNTFWLNPEVFISMLIPSSVSFRYCDILRGIISNIILNYSSNYIMYSSPNVIQKRNEHDLIQDFKSECEMYIHNEEIMKFILNEDIAFHKGTIKELLTNIYTNLLHNGVIKQLDMDILNKWFDYF